LPPAMINTQRKKQYLEAMAAHGWDVLLLYGHSWRKDFFRSLVNFNFFGPHATAALSRSGELSILVSHPWDQEILSKAVDVKVLCAPDFEPGLRALAAQLKNAKTAIAGLELMEARFVDRQAVSATGTVEAIRRIKTAEEIEILRQASLLADIGYQYFVDSIEVGMAEFELVAEV